MTTLKALLAAAIVLYAEPSSVHGETNDSVPVVIVTTATGSVWVSSETTPQRLVKAFEWLTENSAIEVASSSEAALVFMSGARFTLGARARARVTRTGLADQSGEVRALPPLPPFPQVAPISLPDPRSRSAAVRVRGREWAMFPSDGTNAMHSATVLRFAAAQGAERYHIEVIDEHGFLAFTTTTKLTNVRVPTNVLKPDQRYTWAVHALDTAGELTVGRQSFVTLSEQDSAARQAFASSIFELRDPHLLALLGILDSSLGLLADAREELRRAAEGLQGDSGLNALLSHLEAALESVP